MDVTIYYNATNDGVPGGVERLSTPLASGFDHWRTGFRQSASATDTWGLTLERLHREKGKSPEWRSEYRLLAVKCGSMADYLDWLTENVEIIEVDGRPLWVNPALGEEE